MYPVLFSFWKISIYSHGAMVALGMILGGWMIFYLAKRQDLPTSKLIDLLLYAIVAGLIGARLNYILAYLGEFNSFWDYFKIWNGGMVSYGGLILGFAVAILYLKKQNQNIWQWLDIGIIALTLGWSVGRVGCFLAGDSLGKVTKSSFGIVVPMIDQISRHPVALYESLGSLLIFGSLFLLYQSRTFKDGLLFLMGVALYSLMRFVVEFFRVYEENFLGLSYSQIFLLVVMVISLTSLFLTIKNMKKENHALYG